MIGEVARSLEAIKRPNCCIKNRFGNMHVRKNKPRKDTSGEISGGKPTEGISKAIKAKRTEPTRKVDFLPSGEEKLDDLDLDHLGFKVDSDMQGSTMSEKEGEIPTLEKSSKLK